ncbi:MAG: pilus assembly protein [Anaerolineae bacterium]|nr:pilus assembly protein [Anaerolineae bacterium]
MRWRRIRERGQSIVEFAIILPFLILLVIGMIETAFALRSYLYVNTACREGVRFASRGRYTDQDTARWMLASGGFTFVGGQQVPFFRTTPPEPNTGIIITRVPIRSDGTVGTVSRYLTGTIVLSGTLQSVPISASDSRLAEVNIERHRQETIAINQQRVAQGYEALDNQIVVVEVFFAHQTLWDYQPLGFPRVLNLYARSVMRIVSDARQTQ